MNFSLIVECDDELWFDDCYGIKLKNGERYKAYWVNGRAFLNDKKEWWNIESYEILDSRYLEIVEADRFIPYLKTRRIKERTESSCSMTDENVKTLKQAESWARQNLKIDIVDYTGFDLELAKMTNAMLKNLIHLFPEIPKIQWLSTNQVRNKCIFEDWLLDPAFTGVFKRPREPRGSVNLGWSHSQPFDSITLNGKHTKSYKAFCQTLKRDVESKWHPKGCDKPESVVAHEFGHKIVSFLKSKELWTKYIVPKWENEKHWAGALLSRYSLKNEEEFFCEAFSQYVCAEENDYEDPEYSIAVEVWSALEIAMQDYRLDQFSIKN